MNIQTIRNRLEREKGARDQVAKDLKASQANIKSLEKEIAYSEKASIIISCVAKATQEELAYRVAEPVSLALASVYDNPYKMVADFQITGRGTTECKLGFERNGNVIKPTDASGGGPIDIASFALRVGAWSLARPRSRSVICLDEPFRFLSRNKLPLAGQMLKETAKQLGLQIIMITHISELIEAGSKVFEVSIDNGVSKIEEI